MQFDTLITMISSVLWINNLARNLWTIKALEGIFSQAIPTSHLQGSVLLIRTVHRLHSSISVSWSGI